MSKLKTGTAIGVACVAACAGMGLLPVVLGGVVVGGVLGALGEEVAVLGVLAVAGGMAYLWRARAKASRTECGCAEGEGCKVRGADHDHRPLADQ